MPAMDEIMERLDETFKDVTDVTEPGNMDKVLMILEEIRLEDDEYMELLVNKLKDEEVTWDRPWYQLSFCLTRKPPPPPSTEEVENYDTDPFTIEEGEIIEKNWKQFVWEFELPDKPICLARWRNRAKTKNAKRCPEEWVRNYVTAYLAQGLRRNLYQVNRFFLKEYAYPVKLRNYTPTEEKIMEICFYNRPKDAGIIVSTVLGREARGIYKRLFEYFNGKPERKQKLKWTLELASKLVRLLMEYSGCAFEELKTKEFEQSVWLKVEEVMGQQYRYLQAFWYSKLHVQLFAKCSVKTKALRKIILKKLNKSSYRIWSDIRWKDMVKEFPDGFTHAFLYKMAHILFRRYPGYLTSPLPKVLARILGDTKRKCLQKRLKTLKLSKKGNLKYVLYDTPLKQLMPAH